MNPPPWRISILQLRRADLLPIDLLKVPRCLSSVYVSCTTLLTIISFMIFRLALGQVTGTEIAKGRCVIGVVGLKSDLRDEDHVTRG
jgi:hypothetical protein